MPKFVAKSKKKMDSNVIRSFLGHYAPGGVVDASVMWLMMKSKMFFHPYNREFIKAKLLEFSYTSLNNNRIASLLEDTGLDQKRSLLLIENLYAFYFPGIPLDEGLLSKNDLRGIRAIIRDSRIRRSTETYDKNIRDMWIEFFYQILPVIFSAHNKIFTETTKVDDIVSAIVREVDSNKSINAKKGYILSIFDEYRKSLLNRIRTPLGDFEDIAKASTYGKERLLEDKQVRRLTAVIAERYATPCDYWRNYAREGAKSKALLCMMSSLATTPVTPAVIVKTNLNSYTSQLEKVNNSLAIVLANMGVALRELQEEMGICISIGVNVNVNIGTNNVALPQISPNQTEEEGYTTGKPDGLKLPQILDVRNARKYYELAVKKGWLKVNNDGTPTWIGVQSRGRSSQLAYFLGRIYGYKYSLHGNDGDNKIDFALLEKVFNDTKLSTKLEQVYETKKQQSWRAVIDEQMQDS